MAKNRRGRRRRSNKSLNNQDSSLKIDEIRTCVSSGKSDKSCMSSLHIADMLSPISTPSPKCCEHVEPFRPRSRSSISRFNLSLIEKTNIQEENIHFETPKSSFSRIKFSEGTSTDVVEYKTPMKRMRSASYVDNIIPEQKPFKRTKSNTEAVRTKNNCNNDLFTPSMPKSNSCRYKVRESIHSSTPKNMIKEKAEVKVSQKGTSGPKQALVSIQSLSPIPKSETILMPTKRIIKNLKKYRKSSIRWTFGIIDFCNWLGITLKKVTSNAFYSFILSL